MFADIREVTVFRPQVLNETTRMIILDSDVFKHETKTVAPARSIFTALSHLVNSGLSRSVECKLDRALPKTIVLPRPSTVLQDIITSYGSPRPANPPAAIKVCKHADFGLHYSEQTATQFGS
jgi:hypothetical protein